MERSLGFKLDMLKEEQDLLISFYNRKISHLQYLRNQVDPKTRTDNPLALSLDIQLTQLKYRLEQLTDELINTLTNTD